MVWQVSEGDADAAGILLGLAGAGIAVDGGDNVPAPLPSIDADGQPCRCSAMKQKPASARPCPPADL